MGICGRGSYGKPIFFCWETIYSWWDGYRWISTVFFWSICWGVNEKWEIPNLNMKPTFCQYRERTSSSRIHWIRGPCSKQVCVNPSYTGRGTEVTAQRRGFCGGTDISEDAHWRTCKCKSWFQIFMNAVVTNIVTNTSPPKLFGFHLGFVVWIYLQPLPCVFFSDSSDVSASHGLTILDSTLGFTARPVRVLFTSWNYPAIEVDHVPTSCLNMVDFLCYSHFWRMIMCQQTMRIWQDVTC